MIYNERGSRRLERAFLVVNLCDFNTFFVSWEISKGRILLMKILFFPVFGTSKSSAEWGTNAIRKYVSLLSRFYSEEGDYIILRMGSIR